MPRRGLRTRSYKKVARRTEKGVHIHTRRKGPGKARCRCGRPLSGVSLKGKGSKSSRTTSRPFGGSLCPVCTRREIAASARAQIEAGSS